MSNARIAALVLLLTTLGVVSCATWVEKAAAPPAPLAVETAVPETSAAATTQPPRDPLAARRLLIPVKGLARKDLRDNFGEKRGVRRHHALDIMAPRGTPVVAADDGRVVKIRRHILGGLSVYQYDSEERYAYYYAHLDAFAKDLEEGRMIERGDLIGYVGTTGNAPASAPHLHFAIIAMGPERKWYKGTLVNPYPYLVAATAK